MCAVVAVAMAAVAVASDGGKGRGFGESIAWHNDLAEAKRVAADNGKPIVVLVHKTWYASKCTTFALS